MHNFEAILEKICWIRIRGQYKKNTPTVDKIEDEEDVLYENVEGV